MKPAPCLSQLFFYVENIHSLNSDVNSVYSNDTKIDFLIQQLFVENISITKNFESLYLECKNQINVFIPIVQMEILCIYYTDNLIINWWFVCCVASDVNIYYSILSKNKNKMF